MNDDDPTDNPPGDGPGDPDDFAKMFGGLGGGFDPMAAFSMFGDMSQMLSGLGSSSWDGAKQIAASIAAGFEGEDNVDPADRIAYEQLTRVAELHVAEATGLTISDTGTITIRPATRQEWASTTVDAYRPLLETLGANLGSAVTKEAEDLPTEFEDPTQQMMGNLFKMLGPMMLSLTAGSMVGHLAQRSLGSYDLPIPREVPADRTSAELLVVHTNLTNFTEEWSVPADDVRLWVCLNELAHHSLLRIPHVHERLMRLLGDYAAGFRPDPRAIEERFGAIDLNDPSSMESLQAAMQDPEAIMGVMQSDEQREILPYISALVATIEGYVDHIMDQIGTRLIGSYSMLSEALRRRRVTANPADRFVERMLGLEVDQGCYDRGQAFIDGIVSRTDETRLARLWTSVDQLPTPSEVDAPGLWLARTDLELDQPDQP